MIDTRTTNPASWPAFVIAAVILALILLYLWASQRFRQWRCLHLHPELVEAGEGVSVFRCRDCGLTSIEAKIS